MSDWLDKHSGGLISTTTIISSLNFVANLINSLSDGEIDGAEFHKLATSGSAIQLVLLIAVMIYIKKKKK